MLETKCLLVQRQGRYATSTSIDERGEQTINRDTKTSGGIKSFECNRKSVLKWCLNRSEQASNSRALLDLWGVGVVNGQYKPSKPSQIILTENLVGSTINVLINKYLNHFDESMDPNYLFNLSSGELVPNDLANNILNIHNEGTMLADDLINKRINSNGVSFHHAISVNKTFSFSKAKQKSCYKK